jgi:uncharacterized protein (TIGR02246 family)
MKRLLILPPLILLAGCGGGDVTPVPSGDVEGSLVQMIHEWNDGVVKGETAQIERILADDFLGTLPDGQVMSKRQHIEEVATGAYTATMIDITSSDARVFGDAAVVTFGETETSRTGKKDTSGRSLWTEMFVKRNGRWQVVAEHGTRLADLAP